MSDLNAFIRRDKKEMKKIYDGVTCMDNTTRALITIYTDNNSPNMLNWVSNHREFEEIITGALRMGLDLSRLKHLTLIKGNHMDKC